MLDSMANEVVTLLNDNKIHAIVAFPNKKIPRDEDYVVAVGIKKANISNSGFGNYLGFVGEEDTTGFLCDAVVSLSIYAGVDTDITKATDSLISAIMFAGNTKTPSLSFSATKYDSDSRMLKQDCELFATFWITKSEEETERFGEFTVKGILSI